MPVLYYGDTVTRIRNQVRSVTIIDFQNGKEEGLLCHNANGKFVKVMQVRKDLYAEHEVNAAIVELNV